MRRVLLNSFLSLVTIVFVTGIAFSQNVSGTVKVTLKYLDKSYFEAKLKKAGMEDELSEKVQLKFRYYRTNKWLFDKTISLEKNERNGRIRYSAEFKERKNLNFSKLLECQMTLLTKKGKFFAYTGASIPVSKYGKSYYFYVSDKTFFILTENPEHKWPKKGTEIKVTPRTQIDMSRSVFSKLEKGGDDLEKNDNGKVPIYIQLFKKNKKKPFDAFEYTATARGSINLYHSGGKSFALKEGIPIKYRMYCKTKNGKYFVYESTAIPHTIQSAIGYGNPAAIRFETNFEKLITEGEFAALDKPKKKMKKEKKKKEKKKKKKKKKKGIFKRFR